jgi:hypothetical protein
LDEAREAMEELNDLETHWATTDSRVLGHVVLSPPIGVGVDEGYTEDWTVIEIDTSKVDTSNFNGNAIDLGTHIPVEDFILMMYPNPGNPQSFKYPPDRLLRLKGNHFGQADASATLFDAVPHGNQAR